MSQIDSSSGGGPTHLKIKKDTVRIDKLIDEVIDLYEIDEIIQIKKDKNK